MLELLLCLIVSRYVQADINDSRVAHEDHVGLTGCHKSSNLVLVFFIGSTTWIFRMTLSACFGLGKLDLASKPLEVDLF